MAVTPVRLYSTPTCPYCAMAKQFFTSMKIPYAELDVSRDEEAAHEMMHKTGQIGVPVIEIGNTMIVGFDRPTVLKVLEQEGVIRKKAKKPEGAPKTGKAEKDAKAEKPAKAKRPKAQAASSGKKT